VRLTVLDPAEAVDLLTRVITHHDPGRDLEGTDDLCAELGFLPLAIKQAAYIAETGITPRAYLNLLADYPATMYRATAEGGDAQRTIARIWHVTLDQLTGTPLAGDLLRILAWYAPDAIPPPLLDGLASPPDLAHAIGRLAAYSMLATSNDGTIAVHRLVQAVTRTPDPDDPHRQPHAIELARIWATERLAAFLPPGTENPADWPTWRTLLPHVGALTDNTHTDTQTTAWLLNRTGLFLVDQGLVSRAIGYLQRTVNDYARILGADHPYSLSAQNGLASAYIAAGDLARAIPLLRETLVDSIRVRGNDHPDTLICRNNLASAYQASGELDQAVPLFERTLTESVQILGDDHPQTLTSRNNRAEAYYAKGDLGRAIPLFQKTLADRQRVLGNDHPDTLKSRNNLATAYQASGDFDHAVPLFEQARIDCVRVLGEDHPQTLTSSNNLASTYQASGDLIRAIPLFEQNLADSIRVLGEDHPDTLLSRNNLANAYQAAGDPNRAIPLFEQNIEATQQILGANHPYTLAFRRNLASSNADRDRRRRRWRWKR
jgi:tetratricopeptide (TPR) repeat protein